MAKKSAEKYRKYTVVGVVPNEGETIIEYVEATCQSRAIAGFWLEHDDPNRGISIVAVFLGHPKDMSSVCWYDHPDASE